MNMNMKKYEITKYVHYSSKILYKCQKNQLLCTTAVNAMQDNNYVKKLCIAVAF